MEKKENSIIFIEYQIERVLGYNILQKIKRVKILREEYDLNIKI
ncbi:hypothetical protein [Clostridium sp. UBA2485]|nr:hypothetical protein [Clostridium sp. UBA2485]